MSATPTGASTRTVVSGWALAIIRGAARTNSSEYAAASAIVTSAATHPGQPRLLPHVHASTLHETSATASREA